jgi:fatty acid desaturase
MEKPAKLKGGVQMAEEVKKNDAKKILATLFKVILGLVFLGLGAVAILKWWVSLLMVVQGCIGLFLILAGVITLAIAKE